MTQQRIIELEEEANAPNATIATDNNSQREFVLEGLNQFTIQSDEYHRKYPNACMELFRFKDWDYLKKFLEGMFAVKHSVPTKDIFKSNLLRFEQVLMTLIWIESKESLQQIALIFGFKTKYKPSRVINAWMPRFGKVGRHLNIIPFINKETIDALEPQLYIDIGLRQVAAVIDGKDFYTQTVSKNRSISTVQQGNKLHKASIRILTWTFACGLSFEHTKGFFARATEKHINLIWCKHRRLVLPVGYVVSGDKGFFGKSAYYPNFNPILSPAFFYKNSQFLPKQINHNLRSCQLRYTAES